MTKIERQNKVKNDFKNVTVNFEVTEPALELLGRLDVDLDKYKAWHLKNRVFVTEADVLFYVRYKGE